MAGHPGFKRALAIGVPAFLAGHAVLAINVWAEVRD
jgi:hypothetical protein